MGVCNCSMFCCTLLYVHSSIAIILMGKRELIALLNLSSWCLVMVEQLFLAVPRGCLQFVIVVFPDHTHLLFFLSATLSCRQKFHRVYRALVLNCQLFEKEKKRKLMVGLAQEFCLGKSPAPAFCSGMSHMHIFNPMHTVTRMCLHLCLEIARVGYFYHKKRNN